MSEWFKGLCSVFMYVFIYLFTVRELCKLIRCLRVEYVTKMIPDTMMLGQGGNMLRLFIS